MMNLRFAIIIMWSIFITPASSYGQDSLEETFLPHMLDHPIAGCPTNSSCSEKAGDIRKNWSLFMDSIKNDKNKTKKLESYRQKQGIPIDVWMLNQQNGKDILISWDSYCLAHEKEEGPIAFIAEIFLKELDQIPSEIKNDLLFEEAYLLDTDSKIIRYKVPRGDYPVAISSDHALIFVREEEGQYYEIKIHKNGKMQVIDAPNMQGLFPSSINCPKEFLPILNEKSKLKELLPETLCKSVYNFALKKTQAMMFYKSCR